MTIKHWNRTDYSCKLGDISVQAPNIFVTSVKGEHLLNRSNEDVTSVRISGRNFNYLPVGLGQFFNLTQYGFEETSIKEIHNSDFDGLQDLTLIDIYKNPLTKVPENLFKNLFKVTIISLTQCQLKELPTLLFHDLTELKRLWMRSNEIEELNLNVFANNLKLEELLISKNKIKIINGDLLKSLINLKRFESNGNVCINEDLNYNGNKLEFLYKVNHLCQQKTSIENSLQKCCESNSVKIFYQDTELNKLLLEKRNLIEDLVNVKISIEMHENSLNELRTRTSDCE